MGFSLIVTATLALQASAFPFVLDTLMRDASMVERAADPNPAIAISRARGNCGITPCTTFDAEEQLVSVTGEHAYASPLPSQIRGPCPGLNAAANHGYLPRSGVATIESAITGLGAAFGITPNLAGAVAAVAVIFDGDPVEQTWSIGGPPPEDPLTAGLFGQAQGLSYSHNNYEGDASMTRADAYLNNGDAHSLVLSRFVSAYAMHNDQGLYTMDLFAQNYLAKVKESIATNPYAFWAPFSGVVAPVAYNFVIAFMSNHTAENTNGYIDGEIFKQFFGIVGDYPNFQWMKGQERIPENWYRRPYAEGYSVAGVFGDLGVQFAAYPDSAKLGGNLGQVNTFTGIDPGNLTGGVFNSANLLQGNNLGCFAFQSIESNLPNILDLPIAKAHALTNLIDTFLAPVVGNLSCPPLATFKQGVFNAYPGYTYHPNGTAQNYKN